MTYVVETTSLRWHGSEIRAVLLSDARDMRVFKDLCEALMVDYEAQVKRLQREPRWHGRYLQVEIPSAGGRQDTIVIERRIVKGWMYGLNPRAPRPDIAPDLDALKNEMDGVLDAATFVSQCPELSKILESIQSTQGQLFTEPLLNEPEDRDSDSDEIERIVRGETASQVEAIKHELYATVEKALHVVLPQLIAPLARAEDLDALGHDVRGTHRLAMGALVEALEALRQRGDTAIAPLAKAIRTVLKPPPMPPRCPCQKPKRDRLKLRLDPNTCPLHQPANDLFAAQDARPVIAPCWSCGVVGTACTDPCFCQKCVDRRGYAHWQQSHPDEYQQWLDDQYDAEDDPEGP